MNVLNAIKVAELRKKLAVIPGKIILALLILIGIFLFRHRTWDLAVMWESIKSDWLYYCGALVFIYGGVSYFAFFMQILKQWFLGLVGSVGLVVALYFTVAPRNGDLFLIIVFVMVMIGPFFDVINFFRYLRLKNQVIAAEEELKQSIEANGQNNSGTSAFGDGFEEGYRRGLNAGKRDAKEKASRQIDYDDEGGNNSIDWDDEDYSQSENATDGFIDEDDGYNDGYDDESYEDGNNSDDKYNDGKHSNGKHSNGNHSENRQGEENRNNRRVIEGDSSNVAGYFADCKNKREIKRRYHDLCKVYHPDTGNVSSDIFCRIHAEYMVLMNQYDE